MATSISVKRLSPEGSNGLNLLLNGAIKIGPKIARNRTFVKMAMGLAENWFIKSNKERHQVDTVTAPGVIDDETAMSLAILNSFNVMLTERKLSKATFQKASEILARDLFVLKSKLEEKSVNFRAQFGFDIPSFILVSPTKACNLRCTGCYADADDNVRALDWDTVDRIATESRELWGSQFFAISGGEPLAYRSQGRTILDLAEKHPDTYFMFYTNGTLISDEVAKRMADLGNIIPMVSLEGWKEKTDTRRGNGVFDKVMQAFDRLHDAGVIYGASLTATRWNAEEILSDDFMDFLFKEKRISICWIFQYMPIGRAYTLDLMVTPRQRLWMWNQAWKLVREKRYFVADFWNHGTAVDGCLSAGGHGRGGYLYIEWNGNVTPCVFVPYSPVNVKDVYARGGNLNDIFCEPFFADLRRWQIQIKAETGGKNLLNPCPMRDHNSDLRQLIRKHEADPIDLNSVNAIQDQNFAEGMDRYDAAYQQIVDKVWQSVYIKNEALKADDLESLVVPENKEEVSQPANHT